MLTPDQIIAKYNHYQDAITALFDAERDLMIAENELEDAKWEIIGAGVEGKNEKQREAAVFNATKDARAKVRKAHLTVNHAEADKKKWGNEIRLIDVQNRMEELRIKAESNNLEVISLSKAEREDFPLQEIQA